VGDPVYGYKKRLWKKHFPMDSAILPLVTRQMLHARTLGFVHPDSNEYCEFTVPAPPDMGHLIEALAGMEKKPL
jgi:23S rRNA pseudouridine1911/1915/1917 synthase